MRKFKMFTHIDDGDRAGKVHFESEIGEFLRTHDAKTVDPAKSHNFDIVIVEAEYWLTRALAKSLLAAAEQAGEES